MTLAQLRALIAVVDSGSFSKAADLLDVTQSGVSHAVAALEKELGAALVERARTRVSPTECGVRVLVHAREMLAREEHIRQQAKLSHGVQTGRVRLGSVPSVSSRLLPGLVGSLARRHPSLEVVLFEGTDEEVVEWLHARAIDVGVVTLPCKAFDTADLISDDMLVIIPAAHRLARRLRVRLRDVASEPFIMSKGGCEPLIRRVFRAARLSLRIRYEVREMATILGMVKEGLGITIVPALALPEHLPGIAVLPVAPPVRRRLALAVRRREAPLPAVETFIREAQRWAAPAANSRPTAV
jgi:DNA-binding transcriptional LysR family regulator